jgi:hypothetical protein
MLQKDKQKVTFKKGVTTKGAQPLVKGVSGNKAAWPKRALSLDPRSQHP